MDFILSYRRFVRLFCPRLPFHRLATPSSLFLHPLLLLFPVLDDGALAVVGYLSGQYFLCVIKHRFLTEASLVNANKGGNVIKRIVRSLLRRLFNI